eukprot:SAG11_NODE_597_length_8296_cov_12.606123_9_plen_266_part_00
MVSVVLFLVLVSISMPVPRTGMVLYCVPFRSCTGFCTCISVVLLVVPVLPSSCVRASSMRKLSSSSALREEIREAVHERQRKMKEKADNRSRRSVKPFSFQPGTKVWLNVSGLDLSEFHLRPAAKLHPRFCGPFTVSAQPGMNRVRLKLPDDCKAWHTFHINRVKSWTDPELVKLKNKTVKLPKEFFEEGSVYEVQKILNDDYKFRVQWYLVQWKGWKPSDATWQKRSDLKGSQRMLNAYDKKHGIVNGVRKEGKSKPKRKRRAK